MKLANAQAQRVAPVLLHWASYDAATEDPRITEAPPAGISIRNLPVEDGETADP